jgi:hypothetical protein
LYLSMDGWVLLIFSSDLSIWTYEDVCPFRPFHPFRTFSDLLRGGTDCLAMEVSAAGPPPIEWSESGALKGVDTVTEAAGKTELVLRLATCSSFPPGSVSVS